MHKILVVEDEPNMASGLKDNLEFEGYSVDIATDGAEGVGLGSKNSYDLILLDVMLPIKSGFDVCKELRANGVGTPIIFLTAKGEEIDKVLGLEIGADDYVTKPFSLRELLARVKAVMRRTEGREINDEVSIRIGVLEVSFHNYTAKVKKKDVEMSHKEYETLHYLYKNKNKTVSRDDLLREVWGQEYTTTTRTVDNFIVKLRQKVENNPNKPSIIITVHGIGYKLIE